MPIVSIDTSSWPTSGAATAGTTGFNSLTAGKFVHGQDSLGRNYIEMNDSGDATIDVGDISSLDMDTDGDKLRVQFGVMLMKIQETLGDTDKMDRLFDSAGSAGRSLGSFRYGTDFYGGEQWRLDADEIGSGVETAYQRPSGLNFDRAYEITQEFHASSSGDGYYDIFVNGFLVAGTTHADTFTNTNGERIARLKMVDASSLGVRYRIYGDRDGLIWISDDDFEIRPRQNEETDFAFRPIDFAKETSDSSRNFWHVASGEANVTIEPTETGGINPNRNRCVVSGGSATMIARDGLDSNGRVRKMLKIEGVVIDTDGDAMFRFQQVLGAMLFASPLDIRFDSGNVQYRINNGSWTTLFSYTEGRYYDLRINRSDPTSVKIMMEDMTDANFTDNDHFSVATISDSALATGFIVDSISYLQVVGEDFQFDGIYGMDVDACGGFSSYSAADQDLNSIIRRLSNRVWGNVPQTKGLDLVPGSVYSSPGASTLIGTSTIGSSGDNLTNFVENCLSIVEGLTNVGRIVATEFIINDLSPVRLSEPNTLTKRQEILDSMKLLIDECVEWDVGLDVAQPIAYPTGGVGGSQNGWSEFSNEALEWIAANVRAYMISKGRPDLFRWLPVSGDTDTYFETDGAGSPLNDSSDDVHFLLGDGDSLYTSHMLESPESLGSFGGSPAFVSGAGMGTGF